jgi:hypothetical protein
MTAISPDSCLLSFPLGESFDQKAHVEPALGAGSCDEAAGVSGAGGFSAVGVCSGWASALSSGTDLADGEAATLQRPNHEDVDATCRRVLARGGVAGCVAVRSGIACVGPPRTGSGTEVSRACEL